MSAISLILIGSVVCLGSASKQDLRRPMPNGRPLATQVDQAAMGQNRYAPYYVEGEKPLRKERAALWPFGPDYDEHDHHHDDHDFHDPHHDDHHHDSHDHYDAHEHHHDQYEHGYEHGHEHGHGRGISEGFREGVFSGRQIGPNWG